MTAVEIIVKILTLLTVIAMLVLTIIGIKMGSPILAVTCGLLTLGFGYFTYYDVRKFIYDRQHAAKAMKAAKSCCPNNDKTV